MAYEQHCMLGLYVEQWFRVGYTWFGRQWVEDSYPEMFLVRTEFIKAGILGALIGVEPRDNSSSLIRYCLDSIVAITKFD